MAAPLQDGPLVEELPRIDIKPLLARLWPLGHADPVTPTQLAEAISYFFTNQISDVQAGSLLMCLHFTGLDRQAEVLAKTAECMLKSAAKIDQSALRAAIDARRRKEGGYEGGLVSCGGVVLSTELTLLQVDIVGTGGDSHNTFNISTTSSILASSLLLIAKHGNKASTSKSGSADLLNCMQPQPPRIARIRPDTITELYSNTNYGFLFAPVFHPGMRHVAPIRRQLPWRTIFNLVGPLANPTDLRDPAAANSSPLLEARMIGVARKDLGPVFTRALQLGGARKAMVVCGDEELDEISCAGDTLCWRISSDPAARPRRRARHGALPAAPARLWPAGAPAVGRLAGQGARGERQDPAPLAERRDARGRPHPALCADQHGRAVCGGGSVRR